MSAETSRSYSTTRTAGELLRYDGHQPFAAVRLCMLCSTPAAADSAFGEKRSVSWTDDGE